jgi:hypothetical protein
MWAISLGLIMIMSSIVMNVNSDSVQEHEIQAIQPQPTPQWDWNPWTTYNGTTVYHSFSEMETELFWIADNYPEITKLESIGKSWQGRDIWVMKVSDNPHVEEEDEPEVYFNSNHHAREWLTIEIALYTLRYLTTFYGTNATITNIVDTRQIWVLPCANPDGRVYDSAGDNPATHSVQPYGWRRNARDNDNSGTFNPPADGVDPNRNYGFLWGAAGATADPTYDTYGGPYPFSEPETAAIRDFARQHNFVFAISFHTYSQLILYPWGWSYENAPDHYALKAVAEGMASVITNKAGSAYPGYTPQKSSGLYPTAGSDDDWLYGELGTFAYCIEMYPNVQDTDVAVTGTYDLFHPREDKVIPACQDNLPAVLLLCQLADNRFQLIDHVETNPETVDSRIPAGASANVVLNVTDNGRRADSFTISRTTISGWTINVTPSPVSLAKSETKTATLSVTVPAGATPGFYKIWVNATSTTNSSCKDSSLVTIEVPHPDDVAPITLEPFTEMGDFPKGNYRIDSLVKNVGQVSVPAFNTQLTIKSLTSGSTVTLFQDNIEAALANQWTIVDHDTTYSTSVWTRSTTQRHAGTYSAWCGSGSAYTANTIQSLVMTQPINLERYTSASLQFWSYYNTELYYDFLMVEGSDDNGQSWDYINRYHGVAQTWTLRTLDLTPFLGTEQFKLRFRFTSDGYDHFAGFYLDDIIITANDPIESIIHGPVQLPVGALASGATQELSWNYNFATAGTYLAEVQTLHGTDGNAANNVKSVMFYINNSRKLPEFNGVKALANPGMGGSVKITWDAGLQINDPLAYKVYRFTYAPTSAQVNASSPIWTGTALEFTDSGLTTGQTYYYVVRATDALGQAEFNYVSKEITPGLSVKHWGPSFSGGIQTLQQRYLRGVANEVTVNGLTSYSLDTTQSSTAAYYQTSTSSGSNTYAGIRVWRRSVGGTETEITSGTAVAVAGRTANAAGMLSASYTPPATTLAEGDSIVIRLYVATTTGGLTTARGIFTTGQFSQATLDPVPWTVSYYIRRGTGSLNGISGSYVAWGTSTLNTNIAVFAHSTPIVLRDPLSDNTLNWTVGGTELSGYNIYRSDIEAGPWDAAHRIASVASDTFTYIDTGRGQGDSKFWWYVVRAVDGYGNEVTNSNAVQEPWLGVYYQVDLSGMTAPCWVLVSIPADISSNAYDLFNDALNGDGQTTWSVAKSWDNQNKVWLSHRIGGSANTLTTVDNTMSVWLWLTANGGDQKLTTPVASYFPSSSVNIQLYTGWNLVGYPSGTSRLASNTLPGAADMVSEWQATSPYIVDKAPNQVTISHGHGYWVRVTADCTWTIQP